MNMTADKPVKRISYIREEVDKNVFSNIACTFIFCYYLMPQYFGISLPFFDLTAQRMTLLIALLYIICDRKRVRTLWSIIAKNELLLPMLLYLFVLAYTAAYRANVGTIMYSFIELLNFFILYYLVRDIVGLNKFAKMLKIFLYVLGIHGLIEYVLGFSLFSLLETIPGLYSGAVVRSGSYRIMGPANHSLGYGLILIVSLPFVCIDFKKNKIDLLQNKWLFLLIVINIFLTGSRSSLAVFLVEIALIFLFSSGRARKRAFITIFVFIIVVAALVVLTYGTGFSNYIMLQVTSIIDELLDTELSVNYGANAMTLYNSSYYRTLLPDIFGLEMFSPFVGRGSGYVFTWFYQGYFIKSVDNFYVATFIRFSYPGMVTYFSMILLALFHMIKECILYKSRIAIGLFIGCAMYFLNLWWLDTLGTIRYVYIVIVFFLIYKNSPNKEKLFEDTEEEKKHKYLKR